MKSVGSVKSSPTIRNGKAPMPAGSEMGSFDGAYDGGYYEMSSQVRVAFPAPGSLAMPLVVAAAPHTHLHWNTHYGTTCRS